ncbi:MAG: alkaline phosphatase [Bacteroidota bacterium]
MNLKYFNIINITIILLSLIIVSCNPKPDKPKNVILFISDGCGYNHVDAASYYQYGETGMQIYEKFPVKIGMSTYAVNSSYDPDSAWTNFNYVKKGATESSASISSISTGEKTNRRVLCVDTLDQPLENLCDKYEMNGKSTGVVTTVTFANATPAGVIAHNANRQNYVEVAREMIMESKADVIIGGGHPFYNPDGTLISEVAERFVGNKEIWDMNNGGKPLTSEDGKFLTDSEFRYVGGKEVWDALSNGSVGNDANGDGKADLWTLIQDRESFQKYMTGETPNRLIGVFKSGQASQAERDTTSETWEPFSKSFLDTNPTLAEMTMTAINVLDENPNGFLLMAEGGAVDWTAHDNILNRTIEEQIDFNLAVEAACDWVEKNSSWDETLIIVTADHETGYLLGPGSNSDSAKTIAEKWKPLKGNGKGKMPDVEWYSTHHTNLLVPFYAKGPGSELFLNSVVGTDPVRGKYTDNAVVGKVLLSF